MEARIVRTSAVHDLNTGTTNRPSRRQGASASKSAIFAEDRICAVIAAATATAAIRQIKLAVKARHPAQILELRLDYLAGAAEVHRFCSWLSRQPKLPIIIATCRRRPAGGRFKGSIDAELSVLKQAVKAGCRWCDVEIETASQIPSGSLVRELAPAHILVSAHDFQRFPRDLPSLLARLDSCQAHAIKVAATCHSFAEVRRLLDAACTRRDLVAIPMGEEMLAARILALRAGSALAYAPISETTAPGQISFFELQRVYRLHRRFGQFIGINVRTAVYGVIADPVAHSLSPLMHNAGFAARRKNAIYLPFHVRDILDFVEAIKSLGIAGFSVTIPHKERILSYLDECDPLAAEIGAVNTVVVRSGKLCGYNTDFIGVLRAMEKRLPLTASRVLLLGAGGSARAAAFALARAGANLTIWARRRQRAQALARIVGGEPIDRRDIQKRSFDAIVNCTPVGMHPNRGSPLEGRELNCRMVMDLIYRPLKTELLRFAERRGIETISGVDMFLAQGAAQWELWMGESAPKLAMRRAVLGALQAEELPRSNMTSGIKRHGKPGTESKIER